MKPSEKHPQIDNFINQIFGIDRKASITNNVCTMCKRNIDPTTEFKDDLSRKEFQISGLCSNCQDKVFGSII